MPNVFYTTREFPTGQTIDTRDFCDENRKALESLPPEVGEVEDFLEEVRIDVERDDDLKLPRRVCSILAVPWPDVQLTREYPIRSKARKQDVMRKYGEATDPPGRGVYCYYVIPKRGARHCFVDERFVHEIEDRWSEIEGTKEAYDLARNYWTTQLWAVTEFPMSLLLEGPVFVHSVCHSPVFVA